MPAPEFDAREVSTLLAALRFWQFHLTDESPADAFKDIADNGGAVEPLDAAEIDTLCERINVGT